MTTLEISDSLAVALCMQLSADYDELHERIGIKPKLSLKLNTYARLGKTVPHYKVSQDRGALNLYLSIIRKYTEYADIISKRKHI